MKLSSGRRRNIGILAHIDAGKTSMTERLLFLSGRIREAGDIESGTTTTDFLAVERERGITVKAAAARLDWRDARVALIDTPGHVDFGAEVERSLRALDGAVLLVCGVAGVQSRTETVFRALERRGAPRLVFLNKMDRRGAFFARVLGELRALAGPRVLAVQLPVGEGEAFRGVIDVLSLEVRGLGAGEGGGGPVGEAGAPAPAPGLLDAARAARSALVEFLAEEDESLLEDFAAGREPKAERLRAALRASCLAGRAIPVLCGSAFDSASAASLLDAVLDYLPEPEEAGCPEGLPAGSGERRAPLPDEAFSALVFKTQADPHFGRLSWARIWSGRLAAGDKVLEAGSERTLRVQKLFAIQAAKLEEIEAASAGDIVAVAFGSPAGRSGQASGAAAERRPGGTGASLCDPARPILYEPIVFEEPVVALALEPRSRADEGPLLAALAALVEEDPSLRLREDRETGRATLAGMGELHLEVALERLRGDFGVAVRAGAPEVAYKECLRRPGGGRVDFNRDNNGDILRATVGLALEPGARGSGLVFGAAPGLKAAAPILQAMRRGVEAALSAGPARGLPVVDVRVRVEELGLPLGRRTELAAEIAASLAAREGLAAAGTQVLEPWMRVELSLPEEFLGEAVAVLAGRSGRVESITDSGGGKSVEAAAPLRLLFGLAGQLRSATAGRAEMQVRFLRHEPAPPDFSGKRP